MKVTLKNDFHGTRVTVVLRRPWLSLGQTKKTWAALCGVNDCRCSGVTGIRGEQDLSIIGQQLDGLGNLTPTFETL